MLNPIKSVVNLVAGIMAASDEKYTIPETFYGFYMDGDIAVLVFLGNCNAELQCRQLVN